MGRGDGRAACGGEFEGEGGALVGAFAGGVEAALVAFDDGVADGEAQAAAFEAAAGLVGEEGFEGVGEGVGGHAAAVVGDGEGEGGGAALEGEEDAAAVGLAGFEAVGEEVEEDLKELGGVALRGEVVGGAVAAVDKFVAARGGEAVDEVDRAAGESVEGDGFGVAVDRLREVEELAGDVAAAEGFLADDLERVAGFGERGGVVGGG